MEVKKELVDSKNNFIKFEYEFLKLKQVTNTKTGEMLQLTANMKILYKYIFSRYKFFDGGRGEYFENQDVIAEAVGLSSRTIITLLQQLTDVGLVEKRYTKVQGAMHSLAYKVNDLFNEKDFFTGVRLQTVLVKPAKTVPGWVEEDGNYPF